jgi:hypothetical protein
MNQPYVFHRFYEDHAVVLAQLDDLERFLERGAGRPLEAGAWRAVRTLLELLERLELRQMLGDLVACLELPAGPARDERVRIELRDFVDLLRLHIAKEESAVFSVAARALTAAELEAISAGLGNDPSDPPFQARRNT